MDSLGQIIRISFFRLFFSISIGFIGILFFFIGYYDKINIDTLVNILKDFKSLIGDGFLFIFLILSILFLVGESLIFLGELLIDELFDFNLLNFNTDKNNNQNTDNKLEKVTPTGNEYITYQNFIDFFKKTSTLSTLQEVSEIHFVISRFFSGIMFIGLVGIIYFLLSLIFKVFKCENVFIYSIFILICICIIIYIILVFALGIFKISVESKFLKLCILLSVLMLIVSLVLKFDIEFIEFILSITLFLLGLYISIKYRAFANLIIWRATKNESLLSRLRDRLKIL